MKNKYKFNKKNCVYFSIVVVVVDCGEGGGLTSQPDRFHSTLVMSSRT